MKTKKGFMKTIALFVVLLVAVVAGIIWYLNNKEEVEKFRQDARSTVQESVQEKKEEVVDDVIQESKNSVGEMLKNAGEKIMENDSETVQENEENINDEQVVE